MINAIIKSVLLISIPILLYFILEIPGILIGMAISNLLASFNFFKLLNKNLKSFADIKASYKVVINNFGTESSYTLPRLADKLVIVPLYGFFYTGIYQFNLQILFAFEILPIALHSFLLPEESSGRTHRKIYYYLLLISSILVVVVIVFSPFVINQIFPKYSEGIPSLQILMVSLIPLSLAAIFNAKLQAMESTKIGYSAIIRVGSLLVLIILLGGRFELIGLSLAFLISTILYASFLAILFKMIKSN